MSRTPPHVPKLTPNDRGAIVFWCVAAVVMWAAVLFRGCC